MSFKSLATQRKKNYIDFFEDVLQFYIHGLEHDYEARIAKLLKQIDDLTDVMNVYLYLGY